jgi:acetylornithine/N-succinyldiaminopimelate aminotransferase
MLSSQEVIALFDKYVIPNYRRYPVALVRGEGSYVWDAEGRRYLDLFPGWGCSLLGHCPPRVVEAVRRQVGELIHVPNTWYLEAQGRLAQALAERAFEGAQCFFCNSGAEAVEAALKLARAYGRAQGDGRCYRVITCENSFHGRTFGALSATGQPKYQAGFEPLVPGFSYVPYGDADAVEVALDEETAAVLVEPIQGEGGVRLPPVGYLRRLQELCRRRGVLLMLDEVQTGVGRTGYWFAFQREGIVPDAVTLAKGMAGGIACGCLIARREVAQLLRPGMHASTFGGNPVAATAALATLETIEQENLLENARRLEGFFRQRLAAFQQECDLIREVRICGAMIGIELTVDGTPVVEACWKRGVLVNCTSGNVIRLLPALNLTLEQAEEGCEVLCQAIQEAA